MKKLFLSFAIFGLAGFILTSASSSRGTSPGVKMGEETIPASELGDKGNNGDIAKELPLLIVQGKVRIGTTTPIDWIPWKVSLAMWGPSPA